VALAARFAANAFRAKENMRYMVVEAFAPGRKDAVYERFQQKGRMLPDGLSYLDSWLEKDGDRCFQLMETDSPELFDRWIDQWKDLVSFEVIEVEPQELINQRTI
jgi:Protein of unknown function (DUF3303)